MVRRSAFYYKAAPVGKVPTPCHQWLVDHYAEAVCPDWDYFGALKLLKDSFCGYQYNSGTDDNVFTVQPDGTLTPHPDGLRVKACAVNLGIPPESMYLHWAVDTTVTFWLSTGITQCFYPAGSRIEVYRGGHQSGDKIRQLCSFVPAVRPAQTDAMTQLVETLTPQGRQYDGLFLDNCSNTLYNWGSPIVQGGYVQECGFLIGSPEWNAWWWQNLRDWLVELRSAFRRLSKPKLLAINSSNGWTDEFLTHGVADRLIQEFVGNPIRDSWPSVGEVARRHRLADLNNVGIWASCNPTLGTPPVTWADMAYGSLCLHLVVAQKLSSTHVQDWTGPYGPTTPSWPEKVVSTVESHPLFGKLGAPTEECQLLKTWGPYNRQQNLWGRAYTRGYVYVRTREPYNGTTDEVIEIDRGPQMVWLQSDGTPNTSVSKVPIKNGGGAIFVRA